MTKYNINGKLAATYPYWRVNLNNSSYKSYLNIINKRALVSSYMQGKGFQPNGWYFSPYRYYTTRPCQENPDWVSEVVNEYNSNCFYISIYKSNKLKLGQGVTFVFYISLLDEKLIKRLQLALGGCGQILIINDSFIFRVQDSLSINEKIIPFFNKSGPCALLGIKLVAFECLKKVAYLKSERAHTTLEGLNRIKKIIRYIGLASLAESLRTPHELCEAKCLSLATPSELGATPCQQRTLAFFFARVGFSLVLYGSNLSSTVGFLRYTSIERALIKIPTNKMSVFIGIILSDASLQKGRGDGRLQFKQKYNQFEYFYSVFFQLSHYCSKGPYVTKAILHKKVHYGLAFTTRSLPCITELYHLFYIEGKKIIPQNLFDLLTWEALVHWVYQKSNIKFFYLSGERRNKVYGLYINVEAYTIKDIVVLMNVLMIRHRLSCTLHIVKQNKPHIYIKNKSMPLLLTGIRPFISSLPSKAPFFFWN